MYSSNDTEDTAPLDNQTNNRVTLWNWCVSNWKSCKTILYPLVATQDDQKSTSQNRANKSSKETLGENLRKKVYGALDCDLHNILRIRREIEWPEWHLVVDENDKAVEIARQFHKHLRILELSSSIVEYVQTIEETFLKFQPVGETWNNVRKKFIKARERDDPELIVKGYSREQAFTNCLNKHLAANSHHFFRRYCTILNCPILDQTQQYTEAFTNILFHPKLRRDPVPMGIVYRGTVLEDKKLIETYKVGATILTTTFLSTSRDPAVAEMFGESDCEKKISVFCIFNIKNTLGTSALDIGSMSQFSEENEILILRYVPFIIKSMEETEGGRKIKIFLDECSEEIPATIRLESNNSTLIEMDDIRIASQPAFLNRTQDQHDVSCSCNEEIHLNTISGHITECETSKGCESI